MHPLDTMTRYSSTPYREAEEDDDVLGSTVDSAWWRLTRLYIVSVGRSFISRRIENGIRESCMSRVSHVDVHVDCGWMKETTSHHIVSCVSLNPPLGPSPLRRYHSVLRTPSTVSYNEWGGSAIIRHVISHPAL